MARIDRTAVGIGIVDPRWTEANISTAFSTFTQEGPRPGGAKAASSLQGGVPVVSGAQAADLDVKVTKNGNPSIATRGAAVVWKRTTDTDNAWRGWAGPQFAASYRPVLRTGNDIRDVDICTTPGTQTPIAMVKDSAELRTRKMNMDTMEFSASVIVATTAARSASICALPDDTALVFVADVSNGLSKAYKSTNDGATWAAWSDDIFPDGQPTDAPTSFRVRYQEGQMIAVYETSASGGQITTYSSADFGQTFQGVSTFAGTAVGLGVTKAGTALISYTAKRDPSDPSSPDDMFVKRLGASFARADSASAITVQTSYDPMSTSIHADDDGRIYLLSYENDVAFNHRVEVRVSDDDGRSWRLLDNSPIGDSTSGSATNVVPTRSQMTTAEGMGFVVSAFPDDTAGDIAGCHITCGWTNFVPGTTHTEKTRLGAIDVDYTAQGTHSPSTTDQNTSLTRSAFARGASWTGAYGYAFTVPVVTSTDDAYLDHTGASMFRAVLGSSYTNGDPILALLSAKKVTDGSSASSAFWLGVDASGNRFTVDTKILTTGYAVVHAGGTTIVTRDMTSYFDLAVYSVGSTFRVYHRAHPGEAWVLGATVTGTSSTSLQVANYRNNPTANEMHIRMLSVYCGGQAMRWSGDGAQQMIGKRVASNGYPLMYQGAAVTPSRLSMTGGFSRQVLATTARSWSIPADHDYPVARIFSKSPSPDERWRAQDASQQTIVCDFGADSVLDESLPFMLVRGANFQQIEFRARTAAGAAATLYTADLSVLTGAAYSLGGNVITPTATGASTARSFGSDELAGGYAILTDGVTTDYRKIASNRPGTFDNAGSVVCQIRLEGITGTEPATGTVTVVAPEALILLPEYTGTKYRYWGAQIKATNVSEAFISAGSIVLGSVVVPGKRFGNGWTMRTEPNVERVADSSGTLTVRQKGPNRRVLSWSWDDGMIQKRYQGAAGASADHVSAGAGRTPLAMDQDVWRQMRAVTDRAKGGEELVVACLAIPSTNTTITDRTLYVAGFLDTGYQVAQVSGESGVDEFVRVETMTLTEAV